MPTQAYGGTVFSSPYGTTRDVDWSREQRAQALLDELLKQEQMKTRLADPLEKAKMEATVRNFETRRGVRDADQETIRPMLSPEVGMQSPASAEYQPVMRQIRRQATDATAGPEREDITTQFGTSPQMRTIRRFTDQGMPFTDPDAAMSAEQRAQLSPTVQAEKIRTAGDTEQARIAASAKGPTDTASSYAMDTASRTIKAIDEVLPNITGMTAGFVGSLTSRIGGTEAANVSADLATVASNVAFNALQAMRDASKTGGALGQVSERELDLLSSVQGSIRQNQSPENLRKNLQIVRESQQRFLDAAQKYGGRNAQPTDTGGLVTEWTRDASGKPVRR